MFRISLNFKVFVFIVDLLYMSLHLAIRLTKVLSFIRYPLYPFLNLWRHLVQVPIALCTIAFPDYPVVFELLSEDLIKNLRHSGTFCVYHLVCYAIVITPPRNRGGVIFSLQFVCVSVCLCVCLSVCPKFLWTKFQPNGCTDLDAVFAKWLLTILAQNLLNLVTLC